MYTTDEILQFLDDVYLAYKPFRELCDTGGALRTNMDAAEQLVLHYDTYDKEYPLMFPVHQINGNYAVGKIEKGFSSIMIAVNSSVTNGIDAWLTSNSVRLHEYEAYLFSANGITISASNIFPKENQIMFTMAGQVLDAPTNVVATPGSSGSIADGTYYVEVSAKNAAGETLPSSEVSAAVSAGGTGSIGVSWDAVTGASSYNVYVSATSGSEVLSTTTSSTSYTITTIPSGTDSPVTVNSAHEVTDGVTIDTNSVGAASVAYKVATCGANDMQITINETLEDGSSTSETITVPGNSATDTTISLTNQVADITSININRTTAGSATDNGTFITVSDRVMTTH